MSVSFSRERRTELLAAADADALAQLAERVLGQGAAPSVITRAEVGMVMLTVREPVQRDRFHLGEVLVTRAEIELGGARGWAMRLGDDRLATTAAAICDAEVEAGRPLAPAVLDLCRLTAVSLAEAEAAEWEELQPTEVRFEEMD